MYRRLSIIRYVALVSPAQSCLIRCLASFMQSVGHLSIASKGLAEDSNIEEFCSSSSEVLKAQSGDRNRTLGSNELHVELDHLDRHGSEANPAAYASLLRRCSSLLETKRVHRHIIASAHSRDRLLLNLLVEMYGKCGSLDDARLVFERIHNRNVFSWTIMIAAYTQHGHIRDASQVFEKMLLEGVKPDKITFVTALDACSTVCEGEKIHELIADAGLESVVVVGNALVNMYGKCGGLEEAEMVFEGMPERDIISWNTMVAVYAQFGKGTNALELFRQMDIERLKPDRITYISLLDACVSMDSSEQGQEMHARIVRDTLESDVVVSNALMNMYGKHGALDKARILFERMDKRDVVSWNVIIGAYAQHGYRKNALELFRKMDLECVTPDKVTFVSIFDAAEVSEVKMIQERVAASGFDSDVIVGNSLVHMHGKCGSLDEARGVFNKMPWRNVSSWNSIVDAYAQNGLGKEAFKLFRQMQHEGVKADKITFLTILDVCDSLVQGRFVHGQVAASGLQSDVVLQTALVQLYAKNASLMDAKNVFEEMHHRDLFAWNSLLTAYAQYGKGEEAFEIFQRMSLEGMKPDEVTFVSLLDICSSSGNLEQGVRIHGCAIECGLEADVSVGNTLINMYGKCWGLKDAKSVFDRMQERNVVSWNAMIVAYVQHANGGTAFQLLGLMQLEGMKPDRITCISCLDACIDLAQAKMIHSQVLAAGLETDVAMGNSLINTYRKCESLEDSRLVFESMQERGVVSWTAMISAYTQGGHGKEALHVWRQMQQQGLKPDGVTFASILDACSSLGTIEPGQMIHAQIAATGHDRDPAVVPALINMYSCCHSLQDARAVFDRMEWKDVLSWNAMVAAYSQHGDGKKALNLYRRMDLEGVNPNRATVLMILDTCANMAAIGQARMIHASIMASGFITDVIVDNTLVNMYGKCGSLKDAMSVFDTMSETAVVSWNSIIAASAQHGDDHEARRHFRRMQQEGMRPDNVTFMSIASACHHAGLLEEAFYYIFQMAGEYGVRPMTEHYACIVGLLGRVGWLDEAETVIRRMPFRPDVMVWKNLLIACRIHNDINRCERTAKELWELDPSDSAAYVMLSNMYAGTGRWNDVTKVRKLMKDGVMKKKEPGNSWIDSIDSLQAFAAEDTLPTI